MRILINTPDLSLLGGVASHYNGLDRHWSSNVTYNYISGRKGVPGVVLLPFDILKFILHLLFGSYDVVLLNPSLRNRALKRDSIFLIIASYFNVKKVVFFHGWSEIISAENDKDSSWFLKSYGKADAFFVLAQRFRIKLNEWGINKPIYLTTTKVDTELLDYKVHKDGKNSTTILFLGRVEEYKGIYIVLETYKALKKKFPLLKLDIAGDGSDLQSCKLKVKQEGILDVRFLGAIKGKQVAQAYTNADLYFLPSFSEGMPTSMLEAMAFGLPIISTPVGGIPDFFDSQNMGMLIDSRLPEFFCNSIEKYLHNPDEMKRISTFNRDFAHKHFLASKVAIDIENKINQLI